MPISCPSMTVEGRTLGAGEVAAATWVIRAGTLNAAWWRVDSITETVLDAYRRTA